MSLIAIPGKEDILQPNRRRFLQASAATIASLAVPALAQQRDFWSLPRELWLKRKIGKNQYEEVKAVYWANGQIVLDGYYAVCHIMRDVQMDLAVQFDVVTLDIARGVYGWLLHAGINDRPLIINSGYRHPKTNAREGGARDSFHMRAQAFDTRIEGISPDSVGRFGQYLAGGGVGFYPSKGMTHFDRGRVRTFRG